MTAAPAERDVGPVVLLEHAVELAVSTLVDLGLTYTAVREAVLAQVSDAISAAVYQHDGVPMPVDQADDKPDEDDGNNSSEAAR